MVTRGTYCEWDVPIVDGTGRLTGESNRLLDALAGHGLRILLDVVRPPSVATVTEQVLEHAGKSAYCVILLTTSDNDSGEERTEFIAVPRKSAMPVPPDSIEIGKLGTDVADLAERIARRLR